jgi:enoyl-CoA hydratase/carnithine racemase
MIEMLPTEGDRRAHGCDWGLANRVVPADALRSAPLELAGQIAEASGSCVGIGKGAFYAQVDLEQAGAYEVAKEIMSNNAAEGDAQEGIGAFLAKRKPRWRG